MDGPRNCHTDWSKSERERQISYDIARYCLRGESMYFISKSKFAPYESQGTLVEKKKKKRERAVCLQLEEGPESLKRCVLFLASPLASSMALAKLHRAWDQELAHTIAMDYPGMKVGIANWQTTSKELENKSRCESWHILWEGAGEGKHIEGEILVLTEGSKQSNNWSRWFA